MTEPSPLIKTLTLEQIEVNLYRGVNLPWGGSRIFGGQVIAQALAAAYQTVDERICHSLQAYFIRPGDNTRPVLYQVERSRDGGSFTTRRVVAIQNGEQIFNLAASFQIEEHSFEHQRNMPNVPPPEDIAPEHLNEHAPEFVRTMLQKRPIEMRHIDPAPHGGEPALAHSWFRAIGELGLATPINQAALAYASDLSLLLTSLRPHVAMGPNAGVQIASLDHALWFHRPSHLADWHLYVRESPNANGARGMNFGSIFSRDGRLVASVAQEGLIRKRSR